MRSLLLSLVVVALCIAVSTPGVSAQEDMARALHLELESPATLQAPDSQVPTVAILETFDAPASRPAGIGWDGANFWVVSDENNTIYKLAAGSLTVLDSFATPAATFAFGLEHNGTDLWGDNDEPEQIYQLDDTSGGLLQTWTSPFPSPNGVAWDGADVWHSGFVQNLTLINSNTGATIRSIPAPGIAPRGLEWVNETLWVVDTNSNPADAIYQIDPSDGTVLRHIQLSGANFPYGVAFDGEYFWVTDLLLAKIYKVDFIRLLVDGFESGDFSAWSATVQ